MKLITLVQVSDSTDEEQGIIAKLLMVSLAMNFQGSRREGDLWTNQYSRFPT